MAEFGFDSTSSASSATGTSSLASAAADAQDQARIDALLEAALHDGARLQASGQLSDGSHNVQVSATQVQLHEHGGQVFVVVPHEGGALASAANTPAIANALAQAALWSTSAALPIQVVAAAAAGAMAVFVTNGRLRYREGKPVLGARVVDPTVLGFEIDGAIGIGGELRLYFGGDEMVLDLSADAAPEAGTDTR